jgi:hypothetical protein
MIAPAKDMPGERGGYNFAVVVQHGQYAEHVNKQLKAKGHEPLDDLMVETSSITKHVVLSLVLVARTRFRIGGEHQMRTEQRKRKKKSRLAGYGPGILQFQESSQAMCGALGQSEKDRISRRHLVPIVNSLELYFRSGVWTNDRLAMALTSFWNAVCTPFQDQSFLGLTTSLEAILSTQPMEITHTLAERAAALIGKDTDDRVQVYRLTKSLYKTRSKIVHGAAFPKKGVQHADRLFITAKHANVPVSELKDLVNLTITVIIAALSNDDYCTTIRSSRNEGKVNEQVDEFFLKQLFSG